MVPENGEGSSSIADVQEVERSGDGQATIRFRCPDCLQKHGVPERYAGNRIRCTNCGQPLSVPSHATDSTVRGFFAPEDDDPEDEGPPLPLPSMEEYYTRLRERQVVRRVIRTAIASLIIFAAVLFGHGWISDWIEDQRLDALDEQVAAMILRTEEAVAELDFDDAHATLEDAWLAVEEAGISPHKTRDLKTRLRQAVVGVSSAEKAHKTAGESTSSGMSG